MNSLFYFILSTLFAVFITWYFTKKQMKKNEITHFIINSYDVGRGLQNEFPKFQLTYEESKLTNVVQVLKGGFINDGRNDISGLKNESDINLILPKGCYLKDILIKPLSEELKVTAHANEKDPNIINFAIDDLFMSDEIFEYTAIIETSEEINNLHRNIKFKHRIPNTSNIKQENMIGQLVQNDHKKKKGYFSYLYNIMNNKVIMLSYFLFLTLMLAFYSFYLIFSQKAQFVIVDNNTLKEYSLYLTPKSSLIISDNDLLPYFDNKTISEKEIGNNYQISFKTNYSWNNEDSIAGIAIGCISIIYIIAIIVLLNRGFTRNKILKILERREQ